MSLDSSGTNGESLQYGEGAFSIVTNFAAIEAYRDSAPSSAVWMRAREHAVRDHMLRTLYPDVDLSILSKSTAGRAASVLVATVSRPSENADLFAGNFRDGITYFSPEGITFVDPQRIIDESPTRFTPAVGAFIADYTSAVISSGTK